MTERQKYESQIGFLRDLQRSPGWVLVQEHFRAVVAATYQHAIGTDNSVVMAKHLGASDAIKTLLDWPEVQERALVEFLDRGDL